MSDPAVGTPVRILCVDDEPYILRSLAYVLRREGFEVHEGRHGEEAIELAERLLPALIFLDVMMPQANGYEVCARLRRDPRLRSVPIVFLSARGQESDRDRGLDVGATRYVTKPFSPALIARLARELTAAPTSG
ncbi:MAG: response regulator [Planctomycetes bacterium]|nr:response regulator [Planctomycetota bacterium]